MRTAFRKPTNKAHPFVHFLFLHLALEGKTEQQLCKHLGVAHNTMYRWKRGESNIEVATLEKALAFVGYQLKITPKHDEIFLSFSEKVGQNQGSSRKGVP